MFLKKKFHFKCKSCVVSICKMSEELIPTGQSFQILYSFCCRMQEQTRRENAFVFLGGENLTELACNSPAHIFMSQQTLVGRWRSDPGKQWSPSDTDTLAFMHLHAAYFSFLEPGGAKNLHPSCPQSVWLKGFLPESQDDTERFSPHDEQVMVVEGVKDRAFTQETPVGVWCKCLRLRLLISCNI